MESGGRLTEEDEALLATLEADIDQRFSKQDAELDAVRDRVFGFARDTSNRTASVIKKND